jgi:hypothetical protein
MKISTTKDRVIQLIKEKYLYYTDINVITNMSRIRDGLQTMQLVCIKAQIETERIIKIQERNLSDAKDIYRHASDRLVYFASRGDTKMSVWGLNIRDAWVGLELAEKALQNSRNTHTDIKTRVDHMWWDIQELDVMFRILTDTSTPNDKPNARINTPLYHILNPVYTPPIGSYSHS